MNSNSSRETVDAIASDTPIRYTSFAEFYPFYLGEHDNQTNRRLHFLGTTLVIGTALTAVVTRRPGLLALLPVAGYGCAWVGHFFFEHNKPATFRYPLYSLMGDFAMYRDIWLGRIAL